MGATNFPARIRDLNTEIRERERAQSILTRVVGIIDERDWIQHKSMDCYGRICLSAALDLAWAEHKRDILQLKLHPPLYVSRVLAGQALTHLSREQTNGGAHGFIDFNDTPGRTRDEVIALAQDGIRYLAKQIAERQRRIQQLRDGEEGVSPIIRLDVSDITSVTP